MGLLEVAEKVIIECENVWMRECANTVMTMTLLHAYTRIHVFLEKYLSFSGCLGNELSRVRDDTERGYIRELGRIRLPSIQIIYPRVFGQYPVQKCPLSLAKIQKLLALTVKMQGVFGKTQGTFGWMPGKRTLPSS